MPAVQWAFGFFFLFYWSFFFFFPIHYLYFLKEFALFSKCFLNDIILFDPTQKELNDREVIIVYFILAPVVSK